MLHVLCVHRCKPGADAFAEGMNDVLSLYEVIRAHAMAYMPLFVTSPEPLTRHALKRLCVFERSSDGSNKYAQEADTMYAWEVFLLSVEGSQPMSSAVILLSLDSVLFLRKLYLHTSC